MDRSTLESVITFDKSVIATASLVVAIGLIGEYRKDVAKVWMVYWDAYPITLKVLWSTLTSASVLLFPVLVVLGVAIEWLYEADVSVREAAYTQLLDTENVRLANAAKTATERAADAEQKAASALDRANKEELALLRLKTPRHITPQDAAHFVSSLRPFAGSKFWILIEKSEIDVGSEQENLGKQLNDIFTEAGLIKDSKIFRDTTKSLPETTPISNRGCALASAPDPQSVRLATAVFTGLKAADIECNLNTSAPAFTSNSIAMEIGLR
jgi:hypothetical protein